MTSLRKWREERGLTQREMAAATGISLRTYKRLERGLIDNPPLGYLVNCARVLDCDPRDIIEDSWLDWRAFDARAPEPGISAYWPEENGG